jgi:long-chain fatty acid transport protein
MATYKPHLVAGSVHGGVAIAALLAAAPGAYATGFQQHTLSAAGLGLANALGADAEHVSSMAYNPAALGFQEGLHLEGGILRRYGKLESGSASSSPKKELFVHDLYATYGDPGKPYRFGLAVNRPFRMDSDWSGDFTETGAATRTELDLVDVSPTVAYRLRPDVAFALGADYYRALDFEYSSVGTNGEITRKGDGDAWGGTVGLMFWREGWSAALTYRTGADLDVSGSDLDHTMRLPSRARFGVKWRPNLRWSIHADVVRTGWGQYEGLEGAGVNEPPKDWDATVGYRLGAMARLSDRVDLRFGYAYDAGPKDDTTFDPRSDMGNQHLLTLGFGWEGERVRYNLGYGYAISPSQEVSGAAVSQYDGRNDSSAQFLMFSIGYSSF